MNSNQTGLMIGPSTGWLYVREIYSLSQQERILREAGANSVEMCLCLSRWNSDNRRIASLRGSEMFGVQSLMYRSLHLPDFSDSSEPENQVMMAKEFVVRHRVATALIHPIKVSGDYPMEYYQKMISSGVPLAVENMDIRKDSGFKLTDLERVVRNVGLRFVLDVQHAYEHDPEMQYANDLFESLEDTLVHLHVSGETADKTHSLVHRARNAEKILAFISRTFSKKNVPLILEGEYITSDELRQEIEFLTKELGFC